MVGFTPLGSGASSDLAELLLALVQLTRFYRNTAGGIKLKRPSLGERSFAVLFQGYPTTTSAESKEVSESNSRSTCSSCDRLLRTTSDSGRHFTDFDNVDWMTRIHRRRLSSTSKQARTCLWQEGVDVN